MNQYLDAAIKAARAAGALVRENFGRPLKVNVEEAHDIKLELDVRSQALITDYQGTRAPINILKAEFDNLRASQPKIPHRDELIRYKLHSYMGSDSAFLIKHLEFHHENEFRVFVRTKTAIQSCDLDVNLQKLVTKIRISPLVPDWAEAALLATLNPICERKGIPLIQQRTLRLGT